MDLVDIALFIIPDAVSFPGTTVPLHVFEPRYRALIKDAVRTNMRVAVCHAQKRIRDSKPNQSVAEILNSNQASYEPQRIFAAGPAEIVEVTADGRLVVEVRMDGRYEIVEDRQSVPYRVACCRSFRDSPADGDLSRAETLRRAIDAKLARLSEDNADDVKQFLSEPAWTELSVSDYSFKIFEFARFNADVMQAVLEMTSPSMRLGLLARALAVENPGRS